MRGLLNAASASEIVFTKGGTEAINLVAACFGSDPLARATRSCSPRWSTTPTSSPGTSCAKRSGVVLRFAPVLDDGRLDVERLGELIGPRTRMVAVSHMSNVLGTVNPVAEIAAMAHAAGALILVDGCQAVVHQQVDVQALDADFYVFSGHKLYGPTGIGALYGKASCWPTCLRSRAAGR